MYRKQKSKKRGFTPTPSFSLSKIKTKVKGAFKRKIWCGGFTPPSFAKKVGGFTLVEMMVSLGMFTIVLSISVGALLSMVSSNRKTQSLRGAMDNLNLA
ncbi:MAG: type II secretion system protein, partial [Candidatus Pacebacteria bacterium]|nr:type II secretion system protein [Candidatus Paceibacterota bacterium]